MDLNWNERMLLLVLRGLLRPLAKKGFGVSGLESGHIDGDYIVFVRDSDGFQIKVTYNPSFDFEITYMKSFFKRHKISLVKEVIISFEGKALPQLVNENNILEILPHYLDFLEKKYL
ncbi:MAG: hypothetical protein ACJARP_001767 [Vicingaceae bacterium]|jgi:hypothetical protein